MFYLSSFIKLGSIPFDESGKVCVILLCYIFSLYLALVKLRGYFDVEDELEEMRVEARKASSVESFTLKQLLSTPELKLPIIIAVVVQVAQQWSGINAVSIVVYFT